MFRLSGGLKSHEVASNFHSPEDNFQFPGLPFRYIIRCQTVRRGGKFQVVAVCRCGRLWRSVWSMTLLYFHGKILDRERTLRLFGLLPPLRWVLNSLGYVVTVGTSPCGVKGCYPHSTVDMRLS